jgi:hypothetical protein
MPWWKCACEDDDEDTQTAVDEGHCGHCGNSWGECTCQIDDVLAAYEADLEDDLLWNEDEEDFE